MKRWKEMGNWSKAMAILCGLLVLMIIPITRNLILLILPLGSGIDDLIFFIIVFLLVAVFTIKAVCVNIEQISNWFKK